MNGVDWAIVFGYLIFTLSVGFFLRGKAGESLRSYFTANRSFPWWVVGTSMVATTFAADTPLAITGIIAKDGISGNWFWWSWVFTFILMSVVFAKRWQRSGLVTDVELIELRYSGKGAEVLRGIKAVYLAVVINGIILGWVFKAMSKISDVFVQWPDILGKAVFDSISSFWPEALRIGTLNNTMTVLVLLILVLVYSSQSGIRGVMITDVFQFVLGFAGAILLPLYALDKVGGISAVAPKLRELYSHNAERILSFWPDFSGAEGEGSLPITVFLVFIGVQWWAKYFSDGSGYLAQRMNTSRSEKDATWGALWFSFAHFVLRTWPWVLAGLLCLILFPVGHPDSLYSEGAKLVQAGGSEDRELAYPLLMQLLMPVGVLGIGVTGLMAAFMSTVDTHINWGSSYLINDVYKRFLRPGAGAKELVRASRITVFLLGFLTIIISTQIDSIEKAWKFFISIAAGAGLPQLLRWFWWRANAYTEISGMLTALVLALILYPLFPDTRAEILLFYIATSATLVSIAVTFFTPAEPQAVLKSFYEKTRPSGFWRKVIPGHSHDEWFDEILMWGALSSLLFGVLFLSGKWILALRVQLPEILFLVLGLFLLFVRFLKRRTMLPKKP